MEILRNLMWSGEGVSGWWIYAATGGRLLLAAFFAFLAYQNLSGNAEMVADFRRWGYPEWFRSATAMLQAAGALLLIPPATCFLGACVMVAVLLGAVATHLANDPWATSLSPLAFLIAVIGTSVWFRPQLLQ